MNRRVVATALAAALVVAVVAAVLFIPALRAQSMNDPRLNCGVAEDHEVGDGPNQTGTSSLAVHVLDGNDTSGGCGTSAADVDDGGNGTTVESALLPSVLVSAGMSLPWTIVHEAVSLSRVLVGTLASAGSLGMPSAPVR